MKAKRRVLALIAAMAMVLSLMPSAVFAVEEEADEPTVVVSPEEGDTAPEAEPEEQDGEPSEDGQQTEAVPELEEEPQAEETSVSPDAGDAAAVPEEAPEVISESSEAWETVSEEAKGEDSNVAKIGNAEYATLADAVAAASGETPITLLQNISLTATVDIEKSLTIDLNNHTITGNISAWSGTVTLQKGIITGRVNAYDAATLTLANDLTIKGSVVVWGKGTYGADGCKTPTLNVYGTINSDSNELAAISTNGTDRSGAVINIYDGAKVESTTDIAIYQPSGNVTITGGTITGNTAIYQKAGTLNISGNPIITGNGEKADYSYYGNGAIPTGDALVVDSCGYPGGAPSVTVSGGTFTSTNANAVGSYKKDENNALTTGFITGGTFSTELDASLIADGCQAKSVNGKWTVAVRTHNFDYKKPDVRWRVINGEMKAIFIYTCADTDCNETEVVVVTPEITNTENVRQYKATDHNNPATHDVSTNYTVTLDGTSQAGIYHWGDICSISSSEGQRKAWYLGSSDGDKTIDNKVADGTSTYTFAVTGNTTIVTGTTSSTEQQAVIYATLTSTTSGEAVFNAKWTIPQGSSVDAVTIYRGYTTTDSNSITAEVIRSKGTRHDVYLNVWNGDYTLNLSALTSGTYQYAMIEIKYTDSSGAQKTLTSPVKKVQVKGTSGG